MTICLIGGCFLIVLFDFIYSSGFLLKGGHIKVVSFLHTFLQALGFGSGDLSSGSWSESLHSGSCWELFVNTEGSIENRIDLLKVLLT